MSRKVHNLCRGRRRYDFLSVANTAEEWARRPRVPSYWCCLCHGWHVERARDNSIVEIDANGYFGLCQDRGGHHEIYRGLLGSGYCRRCGVTLPDPTSTGS